MPVRSYPTQSSPIPFPGIEAERAPAETGRRSFLLRGGAGIAVALAAGSPDAAWAAGPSGGDSNQVKLSLIQDPDTEQKEETPDASLPPDDRVGYAIVGLGRLSLNQILPALAQCKYSKVAALVSGDRTKALRIARQYGVQEAYVHDYQSFEHLADNPRVHVVYIVLPNGMHKEFTLRAAKIGSTCFARSPWQTTPPTARRWSMR